MTATALLDVLRTKGVHLTIEGEHVAVDAPKGALTDDVRQAIRQHKRHCWPCSRSQRQRMMLLPQHRAPRKRAPIRSTFPPPPPYPGRPVGAPFRPGHQVWLYRWDDQTPRFDAPVTIVQMRTLWPGEQDIGWCDAAGEVTWHNARLAVAVETPEVHRHP